jgi:hypothetical protein
MDWKTGTHGALCSSGRCIMLLRLVCALHCIWNRSANLLFVICCGLLFFLSYFAINWHMNFHDIAVAHPTNLSVNHDIAYLQSPPVETIITQQKSHS